MKGAVTSATVYSTVETAKANNLNPYEYLKFIFENLPGIQFEKYPEYLEDFLPSNPQVEKICSKDTLLLSAYYPEVIVPVFYNKQI